MKRLISFFLFITIVFTVCTYPIQAFIISDSIESLGYITSLSQELLSEGLVYTELSAEKDKNQKAYIFEYTPNDYTRPQVVYPTGTSTKIRLKDVTSRYEKEGIRVVGAMNGDFFSLQTGVPMGVVIRDGILISSDPSKNAVGFTESGKAVIGNPDIHFTFKYTPHNTDTSENSFSDINTGNTDNSDIDKVQTETDTVRELEGVDVENTDVLTDEKNSSDTTDTIPDETAKKDEFVRESYEITLDYLNKYPSVYAIYFLSDAYSSTTRSTSPSTEVVLKPIFGELKTNSKIIFEVTEIRHSVINGEIPEGHYILCGDDRSFASELSVIQEGDILELDITADTSWDNVLTALGGGDIILENSVIIEDVIDEAHEKLRNPRTAIGVRESGDVVFFANDGRDSKNAAGVNLKTLAEIMRDLGCITAINLDGGGSTTVYATTPFDTSAKLVNNPSDGSERYISNAILFLNNMPENTEIGGIKITTDSEYILPGSSLTLSPIYHDKSYRPLTPESEPIFTEQSGIKGPRGFFESNIFTALKPGNTTLAALNGNIKGVTDITVLSSPEEFVFGEDKLELEIGESLPLDITALWNGKKIIFNNYEALNYRFKEHNNEAESEDSSSEIRSFGYIENNSFHATDYFDGLFEVSMDDVYCEIPITIYPKSYYDDIPLETISLSDESFFTINEEDLSYLGLKYFSVAQNPINSANESAEEIADIKTEEVIVPPSVFSLICDNIKIPDNALSISFLTKNVPEATLVLADKDGNEITVPYQLSRDYSVFNGWRIFSADLSSLIHEDEEKVEYSIKSLITCVAESSPIILGGFRVNTGEELLYTDIEGSWAKAHITDVYYQELMNGKPYYTAKLFDGAASLTRAEFATILCRFMDIDLTLYSDEILDFADIDTVGEWAWSQIKAVDTLGIMSGSLEDDGQRYFRPQDGITRAEAMQVIGKLLIEAESDAELNFIDNEAIPTWAVDNVSKVVSHGIFSGYEDNSLRPSNKLTRNEAAKIFSLFNTYSFNELLIKTE